MPGLINSHIHLEFSANSTTLKYGNFMNWLNSVIKSRDELINKATKQLIDAKLKKYLDKSLILCNYNLPLCHYYDYKGKKS